MISGGSSGIGRCVAKRFTDEGGCVILIGRNRKRLEETASALPVSKAHWVAGSHVESSTLDSCTELVRELGRVDVLFNNAGIYSRGSVAETTDEIWQESLDVNVTGAFRLTRALLPTFRSQRHGVILNNASTLGLRPVANAAAYAVAKAALVMLTRATALEEAKNGIRACAICPGVVDTPIHGSSQEVRKAFCREAAPLHPLGRVGSAEEVASLVLFLASKESSWTTGAVIPIDGGILLA